MPRQIFSLSMHILVGCMLLSTASAANHWRVLQEGLAYKDYGPSILSPWSHIHVFKIDLRYYQLDLVTAQDLSKALASVNELADANHALLAINGGFFDENSQPLGLRIGHHQLRHPLKTISWWGIFYIKQHTAHITNYQQFSQHANISFAVQSGPRLLINGRIPRLKDGIAERSALGISDDGTIIILVTQNSPLTTTAVAHLLKTRLHCRSALNLDGGGSSQLYANIANFKINAYGFSHVSDAILVKPYS